VGIKQPGLKQMLKQAYPGQLALDKAAHGRKRAILQCHHGDQRYTVGEIRGQVIFGIHGPHDLHRASYVVYVKCMQCPGDTGLRVLELTKLRAALHGPHPGNMQKVDVDAVSERLGS